MSALSYVSSVGPRDPWSSLGLLALRVGLGGLMMIRHGWPKLSSFSEKAATFPDPLGVGSEASLALACVGEFLAPLLLVLGLSTRLAAVPAAFTMGVAAFVVHAGDPLAKREMALLYLVGFLAIAVIGPGRYSLDRRIGG